MKKTAKVCSFILALVMVLSVFAACGETNPSSVAAGNTSAPANSMAGDDGQSTGEEGGADLDPVTLHFYFFDGKKSETDNVWKQISAYTKDTLNAEFDIQFIAGTDYKDKMLVKSAAGDRWDLNFDADWVSYFQMINKDAYMPLDGMLEKYAPGLYETYESTGVLEAAKSKGKIVALPWTMSMTHRPFFQWRGDLAEKAGINVDPETVKTIEDCDALLQDFHEAYPDKFLLENGGLDGFAVQENLVRLNTHFAVRMDDPELKAVPVETTDAYRNMAKYAEKWQSEGIIRKDVLVDKLDGNQLIDQGRALVKWGTHEFSLTQRAWVEEDAYWDYSVLYPENLYPVRTPLANCVCIPITAENPERTLMFLEQMHSDKTLYDMVHYGVEGLTYELDGEEAVYPEGMNQANSNYMDWGGRWALWDPNFMRPDALFGPDFWMNEAKFVESMDTNVISPLEGFNFDTESVKTEMAQITQIYDDTNKMIDAGLAGEYNAAVDKLIADRKAAGVDKVLEELQRQIDEFVASK